jgi:hypothetical protein
MGADFYHAAEHFERRQVHIVRKAAREFIELWDAFMHPDCTDTFDQARAGLTEKLEALRVETERSWQ